ncbi:MAG: DUF2207 domain-containing protein [Armatimonadota bacterium]|nr:DUF2207 domain-containing protein [bacterium]
MKKLTWLTLCVILLISTPAFAWQVTSYHTEMDVHPDSSVLVTETITVDFTGDPHHGIFREIPLTGKDRYGNNYRIREHLLSVTDGSNSPLEHEVAYKGGRITIKIGDPSVMIQGQQTYVIRYELMRAVHFFSDHDEVYWNVVGPEWPVPISNATCVVKVPYGTKAGHLQIASYTGLYGSTTNDAASDSPDDHTARFWMSRTLNSGEAMTIVVGWPKGTVKQPSVLSEAVWFVTDNGYFFLPPLFALVLFVFWFRLGKDPDTGRSEVVAYDPPDGMGPAEIGTLIDERVDMRDISAAMIDLAVRGYMTIESTKTKGFISTTTDYTFHLTAPYETVIKDPGLSKFEQNLVQALFHGMDFCVLSILKNQFYASLPGLRDDLYGSMIKRGYFTHRPDEVRSSYQAAGIALLVLGIIGGIMLLGATELPAFLAVPPGWAFAVAVCGICLTAASRAMPRKTAKGRNVLLGVKGFEEYLSRAEKDNIEYQERQGLFEKFLPHAMALGIADKWARAFEGLQIDPPKWYSGYDGGVFHPTIFVNDLNTASYSWSNAMTSQPRSEGGGGGGSSFFGGGSGFSGGFSGGGGGGGGGGAW